jgi:two-component system, NarL family, nitrate/nitrite response regulator NarL
VSGIGGFAFSAICGVSLLQFRRDNRIDAELLCLGPRVLYCRSNVIGAGILFNGHDARDLLVVSQVYFLRETLAEILNRSASLRVRWTAASLQEAPQAARTHLPAVVLIDAAFPAGRSSAAEIVEATPRSVLVVFGLCETDIEVIAWAEAGAAGYVPNTASVEDLIACIEAASLGEQICPSRIAGSLLRHLSNKSRRVASAPEAAGLTLREREVLKLVGAGLSNKDIARRLAISLGTTKSHVHNLLAKLNISRRMDVVRARGGA